MKRDVLGACPTGAGLKSWGAHVGSNALIHEARDFEFPPDCRLQHQRWGLWRDCFGLFCFDVGCLFFA